MLLDLLHFKEMHLVIQRSTKVPPLLTFTQEQMMRTALLQGNICELLHKTSGLFTCPVVQQKMFGQLCTYTHAPGRPG